MANDGRLLLIFKPPGFKHHSVKMIVNKPLDIKISKTEKKYTTYDSESESEEQDKDKRGFGILNDSIDNNE